MIIVPMAWYEVELAANVGVRRFIGAMERGGRGERGRDVKSRAEFVSRGGDPDDNGDGWTRHVEGACGEMAVSKVLGLYWSASVDTYRSRADVGSYQVRTRLKPQYQLYVRPSDPDGAPFFLARGRAPNFEIIGWIRGHAAKREEWLHEHGGPPAAYFVPDEALTPIEPSPRWQAEIDAMLKEIGDPSLTDQVAIYLRDNLSCLLVAHDRICSRLDEARKTRSTT